jgi:hypothetical protein
MIWDKYKELENKNQYAWFKKNKTQDQKYWIRLSIYFLNEVSKYLVKANEPMLSIRVSGIVSQLEVLE